VLWIFVFCNNLLIPFSVMIISGICGIFLHKESKI
jgi:hypothetical protein